MIFSFIRPNHLENSEYSGKYFADLHRFQSCEKCDIVKLSD